MVNLIIPTLIVSILAIGTSFVSIVLVLAQRWSTHQIEWKPLVTKDIEADVEKELEDADVEDSKILSNALHLQRKGKAKIVDPLDSILETNNF
jgi:hypothetical protein